MLSKSYWWKTALAASLCGGGLGRNLRYRWSQSAGKPRTWPWIRPRGVLYIANFTANTIEIMSLSNNTIQTSINVRRSAERAGALAR